MIPHFADDFRIIRYDKRGHGLSDCPPAPFALRDHTDDLAGLLNYLKVKKAIIRRDFGRRADCAGFCCDLSAAGTGADVVQYGAQNWHPTNVE